ncbi:hypothetical protein [Archangium sp.]|uniref:hypothetical protein n=1 Tax=Archangium sp. TaxID=1872627 RepID=UPI003899FBBB
MRGIGKTALFTVVAMLGWAGCGGPMEEDSPEQQDAQQQPGDVSALHDQACPNVKANPNLLWPPNHKFHLVSLSGAKSISITSVKQDEPLDAGGDGHTTPDAMKVGGHKYQVELRAERSGQGDGRVYCIAFTAKDNQGKTCKGTVLVGVPHDMGQGSTPVDSGCKYNSFGD